MLHSQACCALPPKKGRFILWQLTRKHKEDRKYAQRSPREEMLMRRNAPGLVDSDNESPQRNWTELWGINLHSLSDWMDWSIFPTVWQRACLKRIMTPRSSVSVDAKSSHARGPAPVQWDATLFWGIPGMTAWQRRLDLRWLEGELICSSPTFLISTD